MIKQRILVTGANGQLGKELKQLSSAFPGYDFIFLSREDLPVNHLESVKTIHLKNIVRSFVSTVLLIRRLTRLSLKKNWLSGLMETAAGILAAACKEYNCQFIHISTDYVFDRNCNGSL